MTPRPAFTAAVLTISDRCSRGEATDSSGPALAGLLRDRLDAEVTRADCIPDERARIAETIGLWSTAESAPELILTTGGTGLGPRDITPEATLDALDRRHEGLLELARLRCFQNTPRAYLSRGEAGVAGRSLVINLPGSTRGATEMLAALVDVLPHAIAMLRGEGHGPGESSTATPPGAAPPP